MIHLVLLSGGSGSRLWPLSNNARSKQFLKVLRDSDGNHISMVQRVFSQISNVSEKCDITIATSSSQADEIRRQLSSRYQLVVEPERRDTAPAIMLACVNLAFEQNANRDDTVIVMPIDTYAEQAYYDCILKIDHAVQSSNSDIVLLGVKPTYPSEKYGYIMPKKHEGDFWLVDSFKEKPSESLAQTLIAQGALWNCGVFAFKLNYLLKCTSSYLPFESYEDLRSQYSLLPKNSFDYEVVERADNISVVPYVGKWKDLGTWNTLCEEMEEYSSGRVVGLDTCCNVHVVNELNIPLVALGLENLVIVSTPDGILVSEKHHSAHMKPFVQKIASTRPMYEHRRWGEYRVVDSSVYADGSKALSKELLIRAGEQLSYQKHKHRSEVWTIVSGHGEVALDGLVQEVKAGSVVKIEAGKKHSCRAFKNLCVIEVQLGDVLIEEDIERFGNYWK